MGIVFTRFRGVQGFGECPWRADYNPGLRFLEAGAAVEFADDAVHLAQFAMSIAECLGDEDCAAPDLFKPISELVIGAFADLFVLDVSHEIPSVADDAPPRGWS